MQTTVEGVRAPRLASTRSSSRRNVAAQGLKLQVRAPTDPDTQIKVVGSDLALGEEYDSLTRSNPPRN